MTNNVEAVSQEMMDELIQLRINANIDDVPSTTFDRIIESEKYPNILHYMVQLERSEVSDFQMNLLKFVYYNEDIFEANPEKKWVVTAKDVRGEKWWLSLNDSGIMEMKPMRYFANLFDTKEEAEMWTNFQSQAEETEV